MSKKISVPANINEIKDLRAGDIVYVSGLLLTARDAAHKRLIDQLDRGERLPIDLENQALYYTGPCPAPPGRPIGSCGPTTSSRMDTYTPRLLDLGLKLMIGKGQRSPAVIESMVKNGAIYLAATGGAGALIARSVIEASIIAYEDLGPEAIHRLTVKDMPLIVAIDSRGNSLYK